MLVKKLVGQITAELWKRGEMEKTSRFQQMTRPKQETGERRGTGRTKEGEEEGEEEGGWGGTQPKERM